ncbi:ABC transporter ATP-binding protein [Rathayibacter tanaceti]|uniref:Uncharacterized protein n=2 Tax=Rathayibacter tanaceti TaxID=1671680 RepID=A0ACD2XL15_9MICO|nr:ABC transporter ATP-binding protein [Rathayibacter tanaceti]KZX21367.1 putative siderophore transport system ATP-binding protein YusV [Rathayibacter tanaceti]TCO38066.1 hypothetical protein EV639_103253 [Rathayibacter tanaceti]
MLLRDEPTTFLDVSHQIEVLDLLVDLNRTRGITVLVLHDLDLAARHAGHLVAIASGAVHASGTPAAVLTEEAVLAVVGLDRRIITDPTSGARLMLPLARHRTVAGESAPTARIDADSGARITDV